VILFRQSYSGPFLFTALFLSDSVDRAVIVEPFLCATLSKCGRPKGLPYRCFREFFALSTSPLSWLRSFDFSLFRSRLMFNHNLEQCRLCLSFARHSHRCSRLSQRWGGSASVTVFGPLFGCTFSDSPRGSVFLYFKLANRVKKALCSLTTLGAVFTSPFPYMGYVRIFPHLFTPLRSFG